MLETETVIIQRYRSNLLLYYVTYAFPSSKIISHANYINCKVIVFSYIMSWLNSIHAAVYDVNKHFFSLHHSLCHLQLPDLVLWVSGWRKCNHVRDPREAHTVSALIPISSQLWRIHTVHEECHAELYLQPFIWKIWIAEFNVLPSGQQFRMPNYRLQKFIYTILHQNIQ